MQDGQQPRSLNMYIMHIGSIHQYLLLIYLVSRTTLDAMRDSKRQKIWGQTWKCSQAGRVNGIHLHVTFIEQWRVKVFHRLEWVFKKRRGLWGLGKSQKLWKQRRLTKPEEELATGLTWARRHPYEDSSQSGDTETIDMTAIRVGWEAQQ